MNLKLNISTCPNDTFMFEAMLHGRIDTEGLVFDLHLADIEQLNGVALSGEPDISKLTMQQSRKSATGTKFSTAAVRWAAAMARYW